jgi:hypothetical protein
VQRNFWEEKKKTGFRGNRLQTVLKSGKTAHTKGVGAREEWRPRKRTRLRTDETETRTTYLRSQTEPQYGDTPERGKPEKRKQRMRACARRRPGNGSRGERRVGVQICLSLFACVTFVAGKFSVLAFRLCPK